MDRRRSTRPGVLYRQSIEDAKKRAKLVEEDVRKQAAEQATMEDAAKKLQGLNPPTTSQIGVPFSSSTQGMQVTENSMTPIAKTIYGKEVLDKFGETARKIYEGSSPQTQCSNVIKKPLTPDTPCWICGIKLDMTGTKPGFKTICEHVLPIAQAVFYLSLYTTRVYTPDEELNLPQLSDKILELEYEWSHEICNSEKNDVLLIKKENDPLTGTPILSVDTRNVDLLLNKILHSNRQGASQLGKEIANVENWFINRQKFIKARVEEITTFLNRPTDPGLGNLVELAGWASMVDPANLTDKFLETINVTLPTNIRARRQRSKSQETSKPPPQQLTRKRAFSDDTPQGRNKQQRGQKRIQRTRRRKH